MPLGCGPDTYVNVMGVGLADDEKGCDLGRLHSQPVPLHSLQTGTRELRLSRPALSNRTFLGGGGVVYLCWPLAVCGCDQLTCG